MAHNGDVLRTRAVNSGSWHRGNASCAATPAIECRVRLQVFPELRRNGRLCVA